MSILCAVTSLFQLVIFVALTGILVSVAAVSRLMELTIGFLHPLTIFLLHQSGRIVILEVILTDLRGKFPCLQYILQPQYAPYLNTAGMVLLGWLTVSWISYVFRALFAPLTIAVIAIILLCPMTTRWCLEQTVPEIAIKDFWRNVTCFNSSAYKNWPGKL